MTLGERWDAEDAAHQGHSDETLGRLAARQRCEAPAVPGRAAAAVDLLDAEQDAPDTTAHRVVQRSASETPAGRRAREPDGRRRESAIGQDAATRASAIALCPTCVAPPITEGPCGRAAREHEAPARRERERGRRREMPVVPPTGTGGSRGRLERRIEAAIGAEAREAAGAGHDQMPWQSRAPLEGGTPVASTSPPDPEGRIELTVRLEPGDEDRTPGCARSPGAERDDTAAARQADQRRAPLSPPSSTCPPLPNVPSRAPLAVRRTTAAETSPGKSVVVARQMPSTVRPRPSIASACVLANVTPGIGNWRNPP